MCGREFEIPNTKETRVEVLTEGVCQPKSIRFQHMKSALKSLSEVNETYSDNVLIEHVGTVS